MNKIKALYVNEIIKVTKKISILILLIIMAAGVFGLGGLMKVQENLVDRGRMGVDYEQEWVFEELKMQKDRMQDEVDQLEANLADLDPLTESVQYDLVKGQLANALDQIEMYQLAMDENIMLFSGESYLTRSLYAITDIKREIRSLESVPQEERSGRWDEEYLLQQEYLADYQDVISNKDFAVYIALESRRIEKSDDLTAEAKNIEQERLALWYKLDPSGGTDREVNSYTIQQVLEQVSSLKRSLASNLDYTAQGAVVPLTPDRISEMENQLAVLEYKIDNNLVELKQASTFAASAITSIYSFGSFMIVLMALILAGSSISQEIATGSIKSLIISPAKRWKIFVAKVLSLVTVCLGAALVLYILGLLSNGIFFGFSSGRPYIYALQGEAYEMGFALFHLAGIAVRLIDVFVFMSLALMLSVLTRNTAAAVGISMAAFFGNNIIQPILMFLPKAEWVKFVPYININLMDRFFPYQEQGMAMNFNAFGMSLSKPDLTFSLIYLAVIGTCMIYTALDSFNRRDIK